jgi:S1-C subfamily serine protease
MQSFSDFSEAIMSLAAMAAPALTAIRIGQNRQVTGFLWRDDLLVTTDQALPAAASYTVVLSNGALISARPGPRDPVHNLALLILDAAIQFAPLEYSPGTAVGAMVLALGADVDASPTVRLTTVHSFPRAQGAVITLDLSGDRAAPGGMIIDASGRLLGMTSVSAAGDAIVMPHGVIARFVEAATTGMTRAPDAPAGADAAVQPIPRIAVGTEGVSIGHTPGGRNASGRRGWLGVSLQPITVPDALINRAGQHTARQVVSVIKGGPAEQAGLRAGDVLLALDGVSTSGGHGLRAFLVPERVGDEVEVRLLRDGSVHSTYLTIAAQPDV